MKKMIVAPTLALLLFGAGLTTPLFAECCPWRCCDCEIYDPAPEAEDEDSKEDHFNCGCGY